MRKTTFAVMALVGWASSARAEQFTLFIYEDSAAFAKRTDPAQAPDYWAAYGTYGKALQDAGVLRGGTALMDASTATTLHLAQSPPKVVQGAYVAGKSRLGGYFVIDVADAVAAKSWAAKVPGATAVEVRAAFPAPGMK